MLIVLQIVNVVFIYQYKMKISIDRNIDAKNELLRVKWVGFMILSFMTPFFVFILNTQANYHLLRFQNNATCIILIVLVCMAYLYANIWNHPEKIDPSITLMSKQVPSYVIFGVVVLSMIILPINDNTW